jgi:hypothetical protein
MEKSQPLSDTSLSSYARTMNDAKDVGDAVKTGGFDTKVTTGGATSTRHHTTCTQTTHHELRAARHSHPAR